MKHRGKQRQYTIIRVVELRDGYMACESEGQQQQQKSDKSGYVLKRRFSGLLG